MEFGVYSDAPTVLHRANPALKIALCLVFLVAVALCNTPIALAVAAAVTLALLAACKVRPKTAAKILKPMAPLMIFVAVLDVVLAIAGAAPASPADAAQAACTGATQAAESVVKFSCAMLGAAMLMRTTTPGQLTRGLATLLAPLRRLGVRTQSVTFALQVTLQFVPILLQEFKEIKQAQTERGAFATTAPARSANGDVANCPDFAGEGAALNQQPAASSGGLRSARLSLREARDAKVTSGEDMSHKWDSQLQSPLAGGACPQAAAQQAASPLSGGACSTKRPGRQRRLRALLAQVKAYIPVIVPVFDSALRRADTLAQAAHNRGF